jgi:predicted porin
MGTIQGGAVTSLPEITTKLTRLNLYARYALQKSSGVRLDYIYDRFSSDDWTWAGTGGVPFTFTDGTTLTENRPQTINFIGVSYYYKFQ